MVLVTNILPSVIFIIAGAIVEFFAPDEVNGTFGYRTFFAMKNKETWKEGNKFSGIMMIASGVICLFLSLIITLFYNNPRISSKASQMGTLIIVLICTFYTEIHLRKIFNKDGKRKAEIL